MTTARDAALARQAQELAEGEVVSTELPIVRELREENARLREDAGRWRAFREDAEFCEEYAGSRGYWYSGRLVDAPLGKYAATLTVDEYGDALIAARAAEGATDHA